MSKTLNGKWIEIFRAGTHTDSAGNTRTWTEADLDNIVNKYAPSRHEAPVVVGHPKDNSPAFGWVEGLKRSGKVLLAKLKQVPPEFEEAVHEGRYKKRSMALYPDMTLRHVGFLGGQPPAVKGLADIEFKADEEAITLEFSEPGEVETKTGGKPMRTHADFCADCKDHVCMSACDTGAVTLTADRGAVIDSPKCNLCGACGQACANMRGEVLAVSQAAFAEETKRKEREFAERIRKQEEENTRLKTELAAKEKEKRTAEFNAFCEELKAEGKLTPAMIPQVLAFMESLYGAGEYEFSEGDQTVKKPALETLKAFLKALPKQVAFGEHVTGDKVGKGEGKKATAAEYGSKVDEERLDLHNKALAYMEQNPNTSYKDALTIVINE